jgi:hypothetical protein
MRFLLTKRFWIRFAIGLALLVALGLVINGVMAWRMESEWQARLAQVRAGGDPASVADLKPEPIPDNQNAAVFLEQVRPRIGQFANEHGRFFNTPIGKAYDETRDRGEPATPEQIAAIRAILDKYSDVEPLIAAAAKCDQYASRVDYSLDSQQFVEKVLDQINGPGSIRQVARFLNWRAEVLLAEGRRDEAVQRGIQVYRLARLYESEPTLVAFLIAIAVRGVVAEQMYDALAAGPVSPELCAALDRELALQDDPARLVHALKSERAVGAGFTNVLLDQPYPMLAHTFGWVLKSYQIGVVDHMDECLDLAGHPWHEVRVKFGPADETPPPTGHGVLADLLTPALRAVFQAHARSLAVSRALRIDIALRQFAEKNGREATGLAELDLPKEMTIDPYSGEPLKLEHMPDGWVIYSVMENGEDDGGDFKQLKDYGLAPPKRRAL